MNTDLLKDRPSSMKNKVDVHNCDSKELLTLKDVPKVIFDKNYVGRLLDCETPEELFIVLKSKNLPMTKNDANYIFNEVNKYKKNVQEKNDNGMLTEESLENVVGGRKASYYISRPSYALGYVIGAIPMVGWTVYSMVCGFKEQMKS